MRLKSLLLGFALALPLTAHAEDITFSFSGANTDSFTFTYDTSVTTYYNGRPPYLTFEPLEVSFDGGPLPAVPDAALAPEGNGINLSIYEYSVYNPVGGYYDAYYNYYQFTGNGIYTVDEANQTATLNLGTTTLYENGNPGTLTISTPSTTPEPSSFLLLGTGMLGAAGVIRKWFA